MVRDRQVKGLFKSMAQGKKLSTASQRADMSENTARKYLCEGRLPSEMKKPRTHRTHSDVFESVWPELEDLLSTNLSLEAKTLFEYLCRAYPEKEYQDGQVRTLQRRVKAWKAANGSLKEVIFSQNHFPGERCQSDYTSMNKHNITIAGSPFPHLLYHFVLTYSNWEYAEVCFSESFESLSSGFQNALFTLGAIPKTHQTDGLSAAVNNLTEKREFTEKYSAVLGHYGINGMKTNPDSPNENGDIEQSNNRLKKALDQRLMLRGSGDFSSREEYQSFVRMVVSELNRPRQTRVAEELAIMRDLPDGRLPACTRFSNIPVNSQSLIRVLHNSYSVPSRLIGERVTVLAYSEYLEVWYGSRLLETMPRLRGEEHHAINYRHIIHSLVKKPGAFENYKYRGDLFLSTHFRLAYDELCRTTPAKASATYLKILLFAAENSENLVDQALQSLYNEALPITLEAVEERCNMLQMDEKPQDPYISPIDLRTYDTLLCNGEEY